MNKMTSNQNYTDFLAKVRSQISSRQAKAVGNSALIDLYWKLSEKIAAKQSLFVGRKNFIYQLAKDLKNEFLGINWFSQNNLFSIRQFYLFYNAIQQFVGLQPDDKNLVQPSAETAEKLTHLMPLLGHNMTIEEFETEYK